MSNPSAFDLLIKEVNRRDYTSQEWKELIKDRLLIIVNMNKGEVLTKVPLVSIGKDIRTYIISEKELIEGEIIDVPVRDFDLDETITLIISFQASLTTGGEKKMALELMKKGNADLVMRNKIEEWTKEFSRLNKGFISNYRSLERDFKAFLNKKAEEDLGIALYPKIKISGVEGIRDEVLKNEEVKVFVDDSDEQYRISFDAVIGGLSEDHKNYILAAPNSHLGKERKEYIADTIIDHLLTIPIQKIIEELEGNIQKDIVRQIDNILLNHGRRLRKLSLRLADRPSVKTKVFRISHFFGEKRFNKPIQIISEIRMKLVDKGKFDHEKRKQGVYELEIWVQETLGEIIDSELFYAKYVDLVLSFNGQNSKLDSLVTDIESQDYLGRIRSVFISRTKNIGYEVQMLIIEPQLPEIKYANEGFEVIPLEREYATKTPDISLKVEFVITGKIQNLRRIEKLISEDEDITERIRKRAEKLISDIVHKLPPDDAFLNFPQYVEAPAVEAIAKMLSKSFAVDNFSQSIIIKQAKNDLRIRFDEISRGIHKTEIIVKPHYIEARNEEFPYELTYKVKAVHPEYWYIFQNNDLGSKEAEIAQINEILSGAIKSILESKPQGEELALKTAIFRVIKQTGLLIDPFNFNAGKSLFERKSIEIYKNQLDKQGERDTIEFDSNLDRKYNQLAALEDKRGELLLGDEYDQDELNLIEDRIKRLRSEIEKPIDTKPRHRQIKVGKTLNTDSLLDDVLESSKKLESKSNDEKGNKS